MIWQCLFCHWVKTEPRPKSQVKGPTPDPTGNTHSHAIWKPTFSKPSPGPERLHLYCKSLNRGGGVVISTGAVISMGGREPSGSSRAPEMHQKHRKSLPNGRQQGGAFGAAPLGFVVFHLVRISYTFALFPEPMLGRFGFWHLLFLGRAFPPSLPLPSRAAG